MIKLIVIIVQLSILIPSAYANINEEAVSTTINTNAEVPKEAKSENSKLTNNSLFIVLIVIIISGIFGGIVRYHWDLITATSVALENKSNINNSNAKWSSYSIVGVGAAFLVPLFLSTISSNLIDSSENDKSKLFILAGFCLSASIFSNRFINSVAQKALENSKMAKDEAREAKAEVNEVKESISTTDQRTISLSAAVNYIYKADYENALYELNSILKNSPNHSEALAWKAMCLKRSANDYTGAIIEMEKALKNSSTAEPFWLYNLACYKCLNGEDVTVVIAILEQAKKISTPEQEIRLKALLVDEKDFDKIKDEPMYITFRSSLKA